MPAGVTCGTCGMTFYRPRALRRHGPRCPGAPSSVPVPPAPSSVSESTSPVPELLWQLDASDSLSPPPSSPGPEASRTHGMRPRRSPSPPAYHPYRHVGIQVEGDWTPVDRVRRQILRNRRPRLRVHVRHLDPTHEEHGEQDDSPFAAPAERRRLCDCETCVAHASRIAEEPSGHYSHLPRVVGVRMVALPGLSVRRATSGDCSRLSRYLLDRPERTWVVCGCAVCVCHRNLQRAWYRACNVATPDPRQTAATSSAPRRPPVVLSSPPAPPRLPRLH